MHLADMCPPPLHCSVSALNWELGATFWLDVFVANTTTRPADIAASRQLAVTAAGPLSSTTSLAAGFYDVVITPKHTNGDAPSTTKEDVGVALASAPTVEDAAGDAAGATLTVQRPSSATDALEASVTYWIQAYSEAGVLEGTAKQAVKKSSFEGRNGKDGSEFVFVYATTVPKKLKFKVLTKVGSAQGPASTFSTLATVGKPAAPALISWAGGNTTANVSFAASETATFYNITAVRLLTNATTTPETKSAAGEYSVSLETGRWSLEVRAGNANGISDPNTTAAVIVGQPIAPTNFQAVGGQGQLTVSFT